MRGRTAMSSPESAEEPGAATSGRALQTFALRAARWLWAPRESSGWWVLDVVPVGVGCSVAPRWSASASLGCIRVTRSTSATGHGARYARPRFAWRPIRRRLRWWSFRPVRGSGARPCAIQIISTSRPIARRSPGPMSTSGSGCTGARTAGRAGSRLPTVSRPSARPAVPAAGRQALISSRGSCRPSTAHIRHADRMRSSRVVGAGGPSPRMPSICATRRTGRRGTTCSAASAWNSCAMARAASTACWSLAGASRAGWPAPHSSDRDRPGAGGDPLRRRAVKPRHLATVGLTSARFSRNAASFRPGLTHGPTREITRKR
jgi:hypothetical protein